MVTRREQGFSLIGVLFTMAIGTIATMTIASMIAHQRDSMTSLISLSGKAGELSQTMGFVQKNMLSSVMRYYGFYGTTTSNFPLTRMLVPYANTCADLTTTCQGDTSLLWIYLYPHSPVASVSCALDSQTILIDIGNADSGTLSLVGGKLNVTATNPLMAGGTINLSKNMVIALSDEPQATLFTVNSTPAKFSNLADPRYATNPDCLNNITGTNKLYTLQIKPFIVPKTGNTPPKTSVILNAMGTMPVNITQPSITVTGAMINAQDRTTKDFVVNSCTWTGNNLQCDTQMFISNKITSVSVLEQLMFPFSGNTQIVAFSLVDTPLCKGAGCVSFAASAKMPVANALSGESFDTLNGTKFSLLKQEAIAALHFNIGFTKTQPDNPTPVPTSEVYSVIAF